MVSKAFLFDKVQTEKTEAEQSDASKRIWKKKREESTKGYNILPTELGF